MASALRGMTSVTSAETAEKRFGQALTAAPIQWLSDNDTAYTAEQTCAFAQSIDPLPLTTPVCSLRSNGMVNAS